MKCEDVMRRAVLTCTTNESASDVARRMRDANIGFLPVVDETGSVLGTITDRDLAIRVLADCCAPSTCVGDVMTRDLVACSPEDDLTEAEQLMARHHKSRIVCVDRTRHPIGVISLSDIAQAEWGDRASNVLKAVASREAAL
jgi:CBS domain-containing protein